MATTGVTAADISNKDTKDSDEQESEVEVKKEIESTAYVAIFGSVLENIVYGLAIGSSWHRNIGFGLSGEFLKTYSDVEPDTDLLSIPKANLHFI